MKNKHWRNSLPCKCLNLLYIKLLFVFKDGAVPLVGEFVFTVTWYCSILIYYVNVL